jgi:hypothetical protein
LPIGFAAQPIFSALSELAFHSLNRSQVLIPRAHSIGAVNCFLILLVGTNIHSHWQGWNMLNGFVGKLLSRPKRSPARRSRQGNENRSRRPNFDQLEDRVLMATDYWINSAGGSWQDAANWSLGAVPTSSDDAVINCLPSRITCRFSGLIC